MADYSRDKLFEQLDQLKIYKSGESVITEFRGRVINNTDVIICTQHTYINYLSNYSTSLPCPYT